MTRFEHATRRTVLRGIGAGAVGGIGLAGHAAAAGGLQQELATVRSATAAYSDPENAYDDGYVVLGDPDGDGEPEPLPLEDVVDEGHAVCGMGYHFGRGDRFGSDDPTAPAVLVYGVGDDGDLLLGGVEWIVPKAGPYADAPPDLFEHDDGEEVWQEDSPAPGLWSLHAWVHTHNPDGVFSPFNPRPQFAPEGCQVPPGH